MSYRDEDDPFEEDIVFDQAGLLSTSRKSAKSAIRRVSSGKCAMFSKTLGLCGAFLGLGLTFAIPGPLSAAPPTELSHDVSLMTYEVMYRCQGFMIGAMFGARLLDRFNRLFLVFLALLVTALLVTIIPWCGIAWLLRTDMFLLGVSLGFLSTGGNVLCLDLWGRNSGPFMQALHFSFSLGIFLAPFLSQPLMAPVNFALVAPSTTPSGSPLHRFPRDVGHLSATGGTIPEAVAASLHPASQPYSDLPFNKSWTIASNTSTASFLSTTTPTKSSVQLSTASATFSSTNSSTTSTTPSTIATKSAQVPTMASPSPSLGSQATSSSVLGNRSTTASASSNTLGSGLAAILETVDAQRVDAQKVEAQKVEAQKVEAQKVDTQKVDAQKVDVSTTTHRAPRPKPVMTNSEKLQDKKWENEKFRKPPPEDLVPVSTTMKPMARPDNRTGSGNASVSSPSPLPFTQAVNSTAKPNTVTNSSKPANMSELAKILNESGSSTSSSNSSISHSLVPLNNTNYVSTLGPVPALHASQALKSNSSLKANETAASGTETSSAMPTKENASFSTVISSTSTTLLSKTAPNISLKNTSYLQSKETVDSHSASITKADARANVLDLNAEKHVKAAVTNHSAVGKELSHVLSGSAESHSYKKPVSGKISMSPGWSVNSEGESNAGNSTPELPLPLLDDPKRFNASLNIGKSISLDEQDSSQSSPNVVPTMAMTEPKVNLLKAPSSTTAPQVLSSTLQPQRHSKGGEPEKTQTVNQKSFGGGHVKAMMDAKPALVTVEPLNPPVKNPEKSSELLSGSHVSIIDLSLFNNSSSVPVKGSPKVLEGSHHVDSLPSPKHIHHSKPASTVVNDTTEVTHTVIDAVANRLEKYGLSRMELMYLTVGMVLLATSFLFLGFLCFNPRDPKSKTDKEDMNSLSVRGGHRSRINSTGQTSALPSRCMRHTLIGLMMMLFMITSGVQAMYGQLLLVYSVQIPLQLSQSSGTALTATFWGALTSTRFACILLASALSPTAMLVLSVAICSCATWLLSAFASSSEVALWIGSVMVSVGTASVFPSGMLWMQRHVPITHRVAAMLVMGPAMGEMFFPTIAYKMMVSLGPASLVHLPALLSLFAVAVWAAVWRLARYPRQPLCSHGDESSGYQLANQHDEDDLLDLTMSPVVNGTTAVLRNHGRLNASVHGVHRMSA